MKKITFIMSFIVLTLVLCGFGFKQKPKSFIVYSSVPIYRENLDEAQTNFPVHSKIYYLIYNPQGFKDDFIRIQVFKKDDKTHLGGYTVKFAQDAEVQPGSKTYMDSITMQEPGLFIMQVAEFIDFTKPIAYGTFGVDND